MNFGKQIPRKMKTKKVTISLTPEQQEKAKKDSIALFGKENLSGYLQVLIQNGLQNRKSEGKNNYDKFARVLVK